MTRTILTFLISGIVSFSSFGQEEPKGTSQKTWTYTYIKALDGQKENLRAFLVENWFAMDSIAVERGLFNDYKLLENVGDEPDWDFIVAVEYFTRGTYSDIQEEWAEIRKMHRKVLIDGYDFPELGKVTNSEKLIISK